MAGLGSDNSKQLKQKYTGELQLQGIHIPNRALHDLQWETTK